MDRFNQAKDAVETLKSTGAIEAESADAFITEMNAILARHFEVTRNDGVDIPEFTKWAWSGLK
jgi:xylulose-5-phosphate/fructose-6-phosphate phosphoketolase